MAPAEAPKAKTRAFEAASDLSNSPSSPFILPKGALKPEVSRLRLLVPLTALLIFASNLEVFPVTSTFTTGLAIIFLNPSIHITHLFCYSFEIY